MDPETENKLASIVKQSGVSKSKWIVELIKEKTAHSWPAHIVKLAGAWKDLPTAEELRAGAGKDVGRKRI